MNYVCWTLLFIFFVILKISFFLPYEIYVYQHMIGSVCHPQNKNMFWFLSRCSPRVLCIIGQRFWKRITSWGTLTYLHIFGQESGGARDMTWKYISHSQILPLFHFCLPAAMKLAVFFHISSSTMWFYELAKYVT